jgi:hypothetical protein
VPPNPLRLRTRAVIGAALVVLLTLAGYGVYRTYRHVSPSAAPPACQAGTGVQAVTLDTDQAGIAATIAGVAARRRLPSEAVTIAYAAALQESKLHNLGYGDRDSIGVFQQRPSQGWGPATQLKDPVYATTKFFAALVRVPHYTKMPVEAAAQAVQHSADGSAYGQYAGVAAVLTGYFTGASPHGVSCWYAEAGHADLAGAVRAMTQTFGPMGRKDVVIRITTDRSGQKEKRSVAVVRVQRDAAWTVASWLVAHAQEYGLREVWYAGYKWQAADGSMGWQRDPTTPSTPSSPSTTNGPPRGSIVAG